jgi:hypothetical protein
MDMLDLPYTAEKMKQKAEQIIFCVYFGWALSICLTCRTSHTLSSEKTTICAGSNACERNIMWAQQRQRPMQNIG